MNLLTEEPEAGGIKEYFVNVVNNLVQEEHSQ